MSSSIFIMVKWLMEVPAAEVLSNLCATFFNETDGGGIPDDHCVADILACTDETGAGLRYIVRPGTLLEAVDITTLPYSAPATADKAAKLKLLIPSRWVEVVRTRMGMEPGSTGPPQLYQRGLFLIRALSILGKRVPPRWISYIYAMLTDGSMPPIPTAVRTAREPAPLPLFPQCECAPEWVVTQAFRALQATYKEREDGDAVLRLGCSKPLSLAAWDVLKTFLKPSMKNFCVYHNMNALLSECSELCSTLIAHYFELDTMDVNEYRAFVMTMYAVDKAGAGIIQSFNDVKPFIRSVGETGHFSFA